MAKDLEPGDRVTWKSHGGEAHGEVERKITRTTKIKGHTAEPTKDDPQYVVESDNGGEAAHKPAALKRER